MKSFRLNDDQRELQRGFREFLAGAHPSERVRELWQSETGRSPELWSQLSELGVVGLTVPEDAGGLGFGEVEVAALLEEAGYAMLAEPLLPNTAVAAPLLRELCPATELLAELATGKTIATVGFGAAPLVSDAHIAGLLLLERDGSLFVVRREHAELTEQPGVDRARRLFSVDWEPGASERIADGADAARAIGLAFDRAAIATAAELIGISRRLIEMAVGYARDRVQFGQPIGSFQAVKHLLADALLRVEFAAPVVYYAASSVAADPTCSREASMAKALASEAGRTAAHAALQVHGAVGYTDEHDLHFWLLHAFALARAWGEPAWHRDRVARSLLGEPA